MIDYELQDAIKESYNRIDGKLVKDNSKYFHYTSIEAFHKIVNSFACGKGLEGKYYPANTNTYGETTPKNKILTNEICLVRSDRVPDNNKVVMSGSVGDIKFTFKEEEIIRKFGKIKPIGEFPVEDKRWVKKLVETCRNDLSIKAPIAIKILDDIDKHYHSLKRDQMEKYIKKLAIFSKNGEKYPKQLLDVYDEYQNTRTTEHMESRIRIPEGKYLTLDLINKIMIPTYLKDDKEIQNDIVRLRNRGFNNVVFYNCKYPKDPDKYKYKL